MRVGVAAFLHESNTFLHVPTTIDAFRTTSWTEGAAVRQRWSGARHEIGGLLDGCDQAQLEAVPLLATFAVPSGTVTSDAFETVAATLLQALRQALPLDGVLLALHGATVSQQFPDADGELCRRVRAVVGPDVPVILTLDLHANVSPLMVEQTDAIVGYRTNPHLDQRERGLEAASLMARTLRGEIRPVQAAAHPPWIIPIDQQNTAVEPAAGLYRRAQQMRDSQPNLLSTSVAMGFYYADVAEMGASFIAVADGDLELAQRAANQMARESWEQRAAFASSLASIDEAVAIAAGAGETPVALFDVGDNTGAGSAADSTFLLQALLAHRVPNCLAVLCDPDAVQLCLQAGIGGTVTTTVGGKTDALHGTPVPVTGRVRTFTDGIFVEREIRHGGWGGGDQGLTAVLELPDETTLILTSRRMAPMSLQQILSTGCQPSSKRAIIVKGVVAPRAAYAPICPRILLVDTPGSTAGNPSRFSYRHCRRPIYPLDTDTIYSPE
jgi:microcystin degradation protein MlrC